MTGSAGSTSGRIVLLVNPSAGRGAAARVAGAVRTALAVGGAAVLTVSAASRVAAEAAAGQAVAGGAAAVAVLGGDGAVHAVLPAVAGTGVPVAVLPSGSGNDLARALGMPPDPVAAARAGVADLLAGRSRDIDLVRSGDRWWATVLCCGLDSAVSDRANRLRWPRGRRRYDVALLAELAGLRPRAVVLSLDGVPTELEVTLIAVGNTAWYGGGMRICPDADPADGLLDVTVIGPLGRRELVRARPRLTDGTHVQHPAVQVHRATEVGLAGEELTSYADGEPLAALPVTSRCVPGALTVLGSSRR